MLVRMPGWTVRALVVGALVLALAPAGALGAPGWTRPHAVNAGQRDSIPQSLHVGVLPNGGEIVAWTGFRNGVSFLSAAAKPARKAPWTLPQTLFHGSGAAIYPVIAVAPNGTTVMLWSASSALGAPLHWLLMRPGESQFGASRTLAVPAGTESYRPLLTTTRGGGFVALWEATKRASQVAVVATLAPGSQQWTSPTVISGGTRITSPQALATGADGSIYASWSDLNGMYVSRLDPGGAKWSPPQFLVGGSPGSSQFAVGKDGTVALVWNSAGLRAAVKRRDSQSFSQPQPLGGGTTFARLLHGYSVAVAADGRVTTVWTDPTDTRILVAELPANASVWVEDPPLAVPAAANIEPVALAVTRKGGLIAVWSKHKPGNTHWVVQSATRRAGKRRWATPRTIAVRPNAATWIELDERGARSLRPGLTVRSSPRPGAVRAARSRRRSRALARRSRASPIRERRSPRAPARDRRGWCRARTLVGCVSPIIVRTVEIASLPSSASATIGPDVMKSTSSPKNGRSRCSA